MQKSFFVSFVIVTMTDGYNYYTISFFSTFTSLVFPLNENVHVHQENVFEEEIMNKEY